MKTKICVDCGQSFTLRDSELEFYKSKGLTEPKRCQACRDKNKARKHPSIEIKSFARWWGVAVCLFLLSNILPQLFQKIAVIAAMICFAVGVLVQIFKTVSTTVNGHDVPDIKGLPKQYRFNNDGRLQEHFEKHKVETDCTSKAEYVAKANLVIFNPEAKHKLEKEDGDDVYYVPSTGEIVFVSKYGFLRTYYIATQDYFNRT